MRPKTATEEAAYIAGRHDAQVLCNIYFAGTNVKAPNLCGPLNDQAARSIIENLPIHWQTDGENNGAPVRIWKGYGHEARVSFGFDRKWGALVDHSGMLFPEDQEAAALNYAERNIRARLISRLEAAERLRKDLAPLVSL